MMHPLSSSLKLICNERLSSLLLTQPKNPKVVVVDVRDEDHVGGHIKASRHAPSKQLASTVEGLVKELCSAETVIFHCVQSQHRGPAAALKYIEKRQELFGEGSVGEGKEGMQKVLVLKGGFEEWQKKFGEEERLTENYDKDVWTRHK